MTSQSDELFRFIGSSFRSVWALELLLLLKCDRRAWSRDELITGLRASELVVNKALEELLAAGLITIDGEKAAYWPVSTDMRNAIDQVEKLYAARPDAVRRAIVSSASSGATAFADAFRLRKD